jgi:hypothetical protein
MENGRQPRRTAEGREPAAVCGPQGDRHSHGIFFARTGDGAIDRDVTHGDTCCRAYMPTKP